MDIRRRFAFGEHSLHQQVDHPAVFRMHADKPAIVRSPFHRLVNSGIIYHKDARVCGEELEACHPLVLDHRVHLGEPLVRQLGEDHMETIVDDRLPLRFSQPCVECPTHRRSLGLHGKVDDARGAAMGGGNGPGFKIVRRRGSAEGQIHVRMDVNTAGDDVSATRVDNLFCLNIKLAPDCGDGLPLNVDIRDVVLLGGDDSSVLDESAHIDSP